MKNPLHPLLLAVAMLAHAPSASADSRLAVNVDARLSLTYNFGRFFVNAYGQFNNFHYSYLHSHGWLNDWYVNTALGLRL